MTSDCIQSVLLVPCNLPQKEFLCDSLKNWRDTVLWVGLYPARVFSSSPFLPITICGYAKHKAVLSNTFPPYTLMLTYIFGVLGRNKKVKLYTEVQHHRHTLVSSWLMYIKAGVTTGCQKSEVGNSRDIIFK